MIFVLLAVALLGAAGIYVLYGSAWARVEKVHASGTRVLTPRQVVEAAGVPRNAPLISVDTEVVAARVREKLPRVATAEVVRVWPNEIGLKVTERKPEVLLKKGGKFIEVDAHGVRFATLDRAHRGVPILELDADQSPSMRRFGAARLEREGVRVSAGLPSVIRQDTLVVRVRSYDSITLDLTGGRTVMWGSSERGGAKARTLLALMKTERDADHFDVSAPSAPALTGS